jgi:hypothetical protein
LRKEWIQSSLTYWNLRIILLTCCYNWRIYLWAL